MRSCPPFLRHSHPPQDVPSTFQTTATAFGIRGCVSKSILGLRFRTRNPFRPNHKEATAQNAEETGERKVLGRGVEPSKDLGKKEEQQGHEDSAFVHSPTNNSRQLSPPDALLGMNAAVRDQECIGALMPHGFWTLEDGPHFAAGPVRVICAPDGVDGRFIALLLNSHFFDHVKVGVQARQRLATALSRMQTSEEMSSVRQHALKTSMDTEQNRLREAGRVRDGSVNHIDRPPVELETGLPANDARLNELHALFKQETLEQKVHETAVQQLYKEYYEVQEAASRSIETAFISAGLLPSNGSALERQVAVTKTVEQCDFSNHRSSEVYQEPLRGVPYKDNDPAAKQNRKLPMHDHMPQTVASLGTNKSPHPNGVVCHTPGAETIGSSSQQEVVFATLVRAPANIPDRPCHESAAMAGGSSRTMEDAGPASSNPVLPDVRQGVSKTIRRTTQPQDSNKRVHAKSPVENKDMRQNGGSTSSYLRHDYESAKDHLAEPRRYESWLSMKLRLQAE